MPRDDVGKLIRHYLPRHVAVEYAEAVFASRKGAAIAAKGMGLEGRDARRSTGFNAHLVAEQRLLDICVSSGGLTVPIGKFPNSELRLYQPLSQHGRVLLSRATIAVKDVLPSSNVTRKNGAKLNARYSRTGDLFEHADRPAESPIHVLLLTLPDSRELDKLATCAVAVVEPDFSGFIFWQEIDDFIAGYGAETTPVEPAPPTLRLRDGVKPYVGEEARAEQGDPKIPDEG